MAEQKPDNLIIRLNEDIKKWEGQDIEFMEDLPEQTHDIAKEIAAFATSNPATIYLGVGEDRTICGVSAIKLDGKIKGKDSILNRLAGICQKSVKPAIVTPIEFIDIDNDLVVVKITIPKGSEPVDDSNNIPYIRNATSAEPATPDQVRQLIGIYYDNQIPVSNNADMNILRDVLYQLSDFQIIWFHPEKRKVNPDLEQMIYDIVATGKNLSNLSDYSDIRRLGLSDDLLKLGQVLANVGLYQFYYRDIGISWGSFMNKGDKAILLNNRLIERVLKNYELPAEQIPEIKYSIITNIRELKTNWDGRKRIIERNLIAALKEIFRRLAFSFNRHANLSSRTVDLDFTLELKTIAQNLRDASVNELNYLGHRPLKDDIELKIEESIKLTKQIMSKISPQLGHDMGLL